MRPECPLSKTSSIPIFWRNCCTSVDELTPICYQNGKRKYLVGNDLRNTGFHEVAFSDFVLKLFQRHTQVHSMFSWSLRIYTR